MRVLLYINSLRMGGAERVIANLASSLSNRGFAVMLVTQTNIDSDTYAVDQLVSRVGLDAGETSRNNLHAISLNLRRIRRLRGIIRRWQPDRVVAFMPTANFVAITATRGLSIPVYVAEHTYPGATQLNRIRNLAVHWAYKRAEKLIVLTQTTKQWYEERHSLANIEVIPNGISLPLTTGEPLIQPTTCFPPGTPLIICVGRLIPTKQMTIAIEVFSKFVESHPEWNMVILGEGPLRRALEARIHELALTEKCKLVGNAGNIQDWYEAADIYLSASSLEGFPTSLLEAMACGCAPIVFDCLTGPSDIIEHDRSGVLIELNDTDAMLTSLRRLASDENARARIASAAGNVVDRFSESSITHQWADLLSEAPSHEASL